MAGRGGRPKIFDLVRWTLLDELYAGWRQLALFGGSRRSKRWREGDDALPEIVLLPGVYEHWSFMRPLGNALNEAGHRVRVVRGLGTNRIPIAETAHRTAAAIAGFDDAGPPPPAGRVIVAHSKGGLVGKHVLMDQETATTEADARGEHVSAPGVLGLIAICTPFAGSRYARIFIDPTIRALMPTDETIVRLTAAASVNSRIVSVYGVFDPHVPEGSVLDGAVNVQVPVAGHFRILRAPETVGAVRDGIATLIETTTPAE